MRTKFNQIQGSHEGRCRGGAEVAGVQEVEKLMVSTVTSYGTRDLFHSAEDSGSSMVVVVQQAACSCDRRQHMTT